MASRDDPEAVTSPDDEEKKKRRTRPGAPVNTGYDLYTQGTLSPGTTAPGTAAPSPVVAPAVPNPLTVGTAFDTSAGAGGAPTPANPQIMRPVDMAANRYRDVATTGTPEERAQALAAYKASVQYKPPSVAERYDPQKWADFNQAQYAKYTATGPDRWLDSPFRIGSGRAQLPVTGNLAEAEQLGRQGIAATSLREETAGLAQASQAARDYRQMLQNAQDLETPEIVKGRRKPASAEDLAKAALWRQRAFEHGTESGLIDPGNPTAGASIDRARAIAIEMPRLARDSSTLTSVATPRPEAVSPTADLDAQIEKNRQIAQAKSDELARRRWYAYNV
jgi:hypothetical protein